MHGFHLQFPLAVPYDFDHAGTGKCTLCQSGRGTFNEFCPANEDTGAIVCTDMKKFDPAIALYNRIKNDIYSLYNNCTLLDEKYKKATIKFLDEFYATINNPVAGKKILDIPVIKMEPGMW